MTTAATTTRRSSASAGGKIACRMCRAQSRPQQIYNERGFDIIRCRRCGFISTHPVPSAAELQSYYRNQYFAGTDEEIERWRREKRFVFSQTWRLLRRYGMTAGARILDVGCAYGAFMQFAQRRGARPEGIDISPQVTAHLSKLGLNAHRTTITEMSCPAESYDVITMLDVLEHLPNFQSSIERCAELLRSGGLLFVRVPNMKFHLWKLRFPRLLRLAGIKSMFTPPDHLNHFTAETLSACIRRAGLQIRYIGNGAPAWHGTWRRKFGQAIIHTMATLIHTITAGRIIAGSSLVMIVRKDAKRPL